MAELEDHETQRNSGHRAVAMGISAPPSSTPRSNAMSKTDDSRDNTQNRDSDVETTGNDPLSEDQTNEVDDTMKNSDIIRMVVQAIDELKDQTPIFGTYRDQIVDYFRKLDIDKEKLMRMTNGELARPLADHCDCKKLKGKVIKLLNKLKIRTSEMS